MMNSIENQPTIDEKSENSPQVCRDPRIIAMSNAIVQRAIIEYRLLGGVDRKGFIYDAMRRRDKMRHARLTDHEDTRLQYEIDKDLRTYGRVERTGHELREAAGII